MPLAIALFKLVALLAVAYPWIFIPFVVVVASLTYFGILSGAEAGIIAAIFFVSYLLISLLSISAQKIQKKNFSARVEVWIFGGVLLATMGSSAYIISSIRAMPSPEEIQVARENLKFQEYVPTETVESLAEKTNMTLLGRKLFYLSDPQVISDHEAFSVKCKGEHKDANTLGCYSPRFNSIYLLEIKESRLNGLMEMTAAHEMLHAGYSKLSFEEKKVLYAMLNEISNGKNKAFIQKRLKAYESISSVDKYNELHSIIGTEISDIPPELEAYYSRYFENRKATVAFGKRHEKEFDARMGSVRSFDRDLKVIQANLKLTKSKIDHHVKAISQMKEKMDYFKMLHSTSEYNDLVPEINAKIEELNILNKDAESLTKDFNDIVKKRNAIVIEDQKIQSPISAKDYSASL